MLFFIAELQDLKEFAKRNRHIYQHVRISTDMDNLRPLRLKLPTTIYLFATAYLVFKDPKYLRECEEAAEIIWVNPQTTSRAETAKGFSSLLMFKLTGKPEYFHRAMGLTKSVKNNGSRYYLDPAMPCDRNGGLAGTVYFLTDLLNPSKAAFPFMDVF